MQKSLYYLLVKVKKIFTYPRNFIFPRNLLWFSQELFFSTFYFCVVGNGWCVNVKKKESIDRVPSSCDDVHTHTIVRHILYNDLVYDLYLERIFHVCCIHYDHLFFFVSSSYTFGQINGWESSK